ncbi:MAG: hypothetical protein BGP10_15865 [Rhodanobacter sp. 68-29]|nr:hypothetical protein [Rhodanobacter sp.]ODV27873.1 MAG: hypothetical protein ABT19_01435 [Rhodanobacter sp. SCN 68-63]OJY61382.1 MAG: hypothetical protein BGP10_15865 [Rhodanobacter sp. 68-29]
MTTWCPDLDGSTSLREELANWLRGDPRTSEPDVPEPRLLERHRDLVASSYQHAAPTHPDLDD